MEITELFAKGRTGGNRGKAQTANPQNKDQAPNVHIGVGGTGRDGGG